MDKKKEVLEALAGWMIRAVDKSELATPEEIEALPKVAEVFFENYSSVSVLNIDAEIPTDDVIKRVADSLKKSVGKLR